MKIKMLRDMSGSYDGFTVLHFAAGQEYDVHGDLLAVFLRERYALEAEVAKSDTLPLAYEPKAEYASESPSAEPDVVAVASEAPEAGKAPPRRKAGHSRGKSGKRG